MNLDAYLIDLGKKAKAAACRMRDANPAAKNAALTGLAELLLSRARDLLQTNVLDVRAGQEKGLDPARLNRLALTPEIIEDMARACRDVAAMPDPIGAVETQWQQPNGLLVGRMRIPLGVLAMIFESRPNVVIDASILCLKAGNAVILRGGSEARQSNRLLASLLHEALEQAGLPRDAVQLVDTADRAAVRSLCKLNSYIDVIIPRGGEGLIKLVSEEASMPVLKHDKGVCHLYVDAEADLSMALELTFNSKVQRPATCNSLECLLVHQDVAGRFLPMVAEKLGKADVTFRACGLAHPHMEPHVSSSQLQALAPEDRGREYLSLVLGVEVVESMEAALNYIERYGSHHTEVICTNNYHNAMEFVRRADASMVGVNASVRLNDGGQLGLGAEIGISTTKLHAYGPMGLKELTATKFVVLGNGQIRR